MYTASTLKTGLIGLIGWRQNRDADGLQLQGLTSTTSGLYYNDVHPLLTFDNLLSIAPDVELLGDNASERAQAFTDWLQEKTEAGIINAVTDWLDHKLPMRTAKKPVRAQAAMADRCRAGAYRSGCRAARRDRISTKAQPRLGADD